MRGRRLTRAEKILLKQQGLNPKLYLRLKKDAESYTFIEVVTGKIIPPIRR